MLDSISISNFNPLLELLVVFNFTYVSIDEVNTLVNNKVFGLTNIQNTIISKIDILIVDIKTELENHLEPETAAHYIIAKSNLNSLRTDVPEKIEGVQLLFRYIYLLGALFTISLLVLGGLGEVFPNGVIIPGESTLIVIKSLSFLTGIALIVLSFLGFALKFPKNSMVLITILFSLLLTISILFGVFKIGWLNFYPCILSITVPLLPFVFNYFGTLNLYRQLKLDYKDIKKVVSEPTHHNIFSKRLNHLLKDDHSSPEFKILSATYGADKIYIDVSQHLNELIKDNRIIFSGVYNIIFTDPIKDVKKTLKVKYCTKGKTHSKNFQENSDINIP
jgi:hypothetical protein